MPATGNQPQSVIELGQRIGRGVVKQTGLRIGPRNLLAAELLCDCGNTYQETLGHLREAQRGLGGVHSCGCLRRERGRRNPVMLRSTHDLGDHPLYPIWYKMVRRCTNPADRSWRNYGGRGIAVWPAWRDGPSAFIAYIEAVLGARPEGMTLDRIDNDRGYEPGNLRWATNVQQYQNTGRRSRDLLTGKFASSGC